MKGVALKTIISTAQRVGRVVALAGGVMLLCLACGAISLAWAAPAKTAYFVLSTTNLVSDTSTMKPSTGLAKALLTLDNRTSQAPALDIQTSGFPPMTVNSDTKVANLNADKLDDKDSAAFALAVPSIYVTTETSTSAINGYVARRIVMRAIKP